MTESGKVEIAAAPISKKVYVHDLAQPRSARTNSKITLVVINRNHVRLKKLRVDAQHDYEMKIDAVDVLPEAFGHTWKHAGLPPDGAFVTEKEDAAKWRLPPDFDELMVLVTTACNLVMPMAALSYYDQTPAKVEGRLEPTKRLPSDGTPFRMIYSETHKWYDELDEGRMSYVLGMLVRLFYRAEGEIVEQNWREQELRKSIIHYLSGTGGTSQFTNFTSLFMSLELAVAFAKSMRIRPDDEIHKHAAALLGDAVRGSGIDPTKSKSNLVKTCLKTFSKAMAGRINEYSKINRRLKHYGRDADDAKYFNSSITGRMRRLRADAAYAILLGLEKSCGTGNPPALPSKFSRTSQVILNMTEDCMDRHGAERVDGGVDAKMRWLADFIENDAIRSEKAVYDNVCSVLRSLETLVKAARMLDMPARLAGVHALAREFKDAVPDNLKPSKMKLDVEHDEEALCAWLGYVTYSIVAWMDDQFRNMYMRLHVAEHGRTSEMKCDPDRF